MSQNSAIGWTDATWNPVTGCSHVSPGCANCYAETLSLRFGRSKKPWTAQNAAENVKLHPERLGEPLRWRTSKMVFVNSMSDLFHEQIPDGFILAVFDVMRQCVQSGGQNCGKLPGIGHTFQVLTKRAERMRDFMARLYWTGDALVLAKGIPGQLHSMLSQIWLGVSVEDQRRADERIPVLLDTKATVRFISFEPLLGRVEFAEHARTGKLHWAITGGESGPNYREADVAWTANIVATCDQYGIAPFVKQDSGPRPGKQGRLSDALWNRKEYPVGVRAVESPQGHTP